MKGLAKMTACPLSAPVRLWYRTHASNWYEALPLGNGRLGAMVHGRVVRERVQLNEETLWEGQRLDRSNPQAPQGLPRVRELLFAGRNREAYDNFFDLLPCEAQTLEAYGELDRLDDIRVQWRNGAAT